METLGSCGEIPKFTVGKYNLRSRKLTCLPKRGYFNKEIIFQPLIYIDFIGFKGVFTFKVSFSTLKVLG